MASIIQNVLSAIYQLLGFSVVFAVVFMFYYEYVKANGIKKSLVFWKDRFVKNTEFRRMFFLALYTTMILFRTLFSRNIWKRPLSNVLGTWGLYDVKGEFTTEAIENLLLFIPFTILLMWYLRNRKKIKSNGFFISIVWQSIAISFVFSFTIEFLQLFLQIGTWQLSDLAYNTLGGLLGGIIYFIAYKIKHRNDKSKLNS